MAACRDAGQHAVHVALEVGRREELVGIDQVEAVMRDARPVGGCDLGRADVHVAIDLARIGADDLASPSALGDGQRQLRLAGRGPAGDDQERRVASVAGGRCRVGCARLAHARRRPTSAYGPARSMRARDQLADERSGRRRGGRAGSRGCARSACALRVVMPGLAVVVIVDARRLAGLDEDLGLPPDPALVALQTDRLLERRAAHSGGAACRPPGRRRRGVPRACRAVARRRPRRPGRSDDRPAGQRRLELGLGLAAEADDDIGRQADARDRGCAAARRAPGRPRRCTGGPCGAGPRRRPTGPAGGGARRPKGTRPWPR